MDVTVKVVELWEPTHDSIDQVGLIGDESGRLKFTKWAKAELPAVEEGSVYKFSNVVTSAYEGRYSINLNLSREVRQRALKLAREASEVGLGNGCRPTGVAAACVYEAGREADEKVTQARLAELASVSDITLREQWKKLQSMLERPEQSGLEVHG